MNSLHILLQLQISTASIVPAHLATATDIYSTHSTCAGVVVVAEVAHRLEYRGQVLRSDGLGYMPGEAGVGLGGGRGGEGERTERRERTEGMRWEKRRGGRRGGREGEDVGREKNVDLLQCSVHSLA
jgi:hypothetical protein